MIRLIWTIKQTKPGEFLTSSFIDFGGTVPTQVEQGASEKLYGVMMITAEKIQNAPLETVRIPTEELERIAWMEAQGAFEKKRDTNN